MKLLTLTLLTYSPVIGFGPPSITNHRLHQFNAIKINGDGSNRIIIDGAGPSGCMTSNRQSCKLIKSSSVFASKFRTAALFARPKARLEEDDDDEDDEDFVDDDDEDEEEGDEYEEDIEIGNEDEDEEEEDLDEITMEYDDDDEEYEEEYYDDDELEEEEAEDYEEDDSVLVGDSPPDVWATYDAAYEDPPTPLLEPDDSDPHYLQARESVLSDIAKRKAIAEEDRVMPRNVQSPEDVKKLLDYFQNEMTDDEKEAVKSDPEVIEADRMVKENDLLITEGDLKEYIIRDEDGNEIIDSEALQDVASFDDMHGLDAFPDSSDTENGGDLMYPRSKTYNEKDLVEIDDMLTKYREARAQLEDQTFFGEDHTMAYMDVERDWPRLSNETQQEIMDVIENSNTMACAEPEMWLMYDLNFNVTNLMLAAFKHNPEAPIIFTQWMPQLEVYERYADQREKEFAWTWDDVAVADMDELERYYKGIGYDSIPKKEPHDTGIIDLDESELDDEEREMLALENWYSEVYNEEEDNILFDDEAFEPKMNVFDPEYSPTSDKQNALADKFLKEYEAFEREFADETQEWRDQFATVERVEVRDDPEGQAVFRGHLVIACAPLDEDLEVAEKITDRFEKEFGKAIYVETRVLGHARKEDNVYEIWLESYEIDLLHSRRQAFINSKLWTGPSDVDDAQLDYLVETVRELISDESRYSYRMSDYADIKI